MNTAVKREIERRRREGESYNDVLERLFGTDRSRYLLAGAGFWSAEEAEEFREHREATKEESKSGGTGERVLIDEDPRRHVPR